MVNSKQFRRELRKRTNYRSCEEFYAAVLLVVGSKEEWGNGVWERALTAIGGNWDDEKGMVPPGLINPAHTRFMRWFRRHDNGR